MGSSIREDGGCASGEDIPNGKKTEKRISKVLHILTQERVRELFDYFPNSGILRHRTKTRCKEIGDIAGSLTTAKKGGYRLIKIDGRAYQASWVIWLWKTGRLPEVEIDHANTLRNDDRWDNLREATRSQNCMNRRRKISSFGYRGVKKNWNKYAAALVKDQKGYYFGTFDTPEEAARAYDAGARKLFGEFALLNFSEECSALDRSVGKKSARA